MNVASFIKSLGKSYPVIIAGLINIAATLAAHYGFHLTAGQLTEAISFVTALLASVTHHVVSKPSPPPAKG